MNKLMLLILSGLAITYATENTLTSPGPIAPASEVNRSILIHNDAVYDPQGNLIAANTVDAVSPDSLYFKQYSYNVLRKSEKTTNPSPVDRTPMAWQYYNSFAALDVQGNYIYEVYQSTVRKFSTVDGSYTSFSIPYYSQYGTCAVDANYLYLLGDANQIYKYTLSGTHVSTTYIDQTPFFFSMSLVNDTIWIANNDVVTAYGYAASRMNGGAINYDATWNLGTGSSSPTTFGFDGTYYYFTWGGTSTSTFKRFYRNRTLYSIGTLNIDPRCVQCLAPPPITHDVGVSAIKAPTGTLDSGTSVTPACSIYNYGNQAEAYNVRMKIGAGYNATAAVSGHTAGTYVYVTFPVWTALPRGTLAVTCSTEMTGDQTPANDRRAGTVLVNAHDVGATAIKAPTGALDSGTTVIPTCSLCNYGTTSETYTARMKIGAGYDNTVTVSSHAAGAYVYVTFPAWTADVRGTIALSCSTELATDGNPVNDQATGSVTVNVHDWAATTIVAPSGAIAPGAVTPQATVHNSGTVRETGKVLFRINAVPAYAESIDLTAGLPAGVDTTLTFPNWTAITGSYTAWCSTALAGDQVPANDPVSAGFQVGDVDVGVTAILTPAGSHDTGVALTPSARVENFGDFAATFTTFFKIDDGTDAVVYDESLTITGLPAGTESTVTFIEWAKPHAVGNHTTRCSTFLAGDGNAGNDVASGSFTITAQGSGGGETGWVRKADLPLGAKSKKVKDGAALTYGEQNDSGYVYAFKGNGRYEFYAFNTGGNVWLTKESIPAIGSAGKKKPVKKGSFLTYAEDKVYGAKGNGTVEFWSYDPAAGKWEEKASVPLGAKALKEGTGAAVATIGDTTFIYLLKGSGTQEFYRYNLASNTWESKASAPTGAGGKMYKNGSALATDGTTIWALKGSYNEMAAYDIATDAWMSKTSLPLIGRLGKKKKVKDGAAMVYHNDYIYTQKGGNTNEFWNYQCDSDKWTQLGDIPAGSGRNVKGGGALTYGAKPNPALYEFKGNNTFDFFKYGFAAVTGTVTVGQASSLSSGSSAQASGRQAGRLSYVAITPNPFSNATTISYSLPNASNISLKLYDITGKLVTTLAEGHRAAGSYTISVNQRSSAPKLASGIYLIKLQTGHSTLTQKLIVE